MKNGKKLVNITPVFPITSTNPPIRVPVKRIYMKPEDIRKCIIARAKVEEVLSDGTTIRLGMTSCFTDNEPKKAEENVVEDPVVEKDSNEQPEVQSKQVENRFDRKHSKKWRKQHQREIQEAAKQSASIDNKVENSEFENNQSSADEKTEEDVTSASKLKLRIHYQLMIRKTNPLNPMRH